MQTKQRGGKRPNAGRKPEGEKALSATIIARVTEDQKNSFKKMGGGRWLRAALSAKENFAEEMPFVQKVLVQTRCSVPVFQYSVQAGFPSPAESYKESLDFNELLIDNAPATFVLRVSGESMIDAGIFDGDLIVVDRSRTPRSGDIVVMQIDNEYTIKRFIKDHNGIHLKVENTSGLYKDIYPQEGQEWRLFGVVNFVIKPMSGKVA